MDKEEKKKFPNSDKCDVIFCKQYTNRWGKLMIATDYGHSYWRFFIKRKA